MARPFPANVEQAIFIDPEAADRLRAFGTAPSDSTSQRLGVAQHLLTTRAVRCRSRNANGVDRELRSGAAQIGPVRRPRQCPSTLLNDVRRVRPARRECPETGCRSTAAFQ